MEKQKEIKSIFSQLTTEEQTKLLDDLLQEQELKGTIITEAEKAVSERRRKKPCPQCKSENVYKRGRQSGVQMYQCKDCKKWYSETTGTPLYDIKLKNKWQSYLRCMEKGMPIKKIAAELEISIQTSFNWRHKILSSLNDLIPEKLTSEVECDELELALNNKGSKTLDRAPRKRGNDFKRNDGEKVTVVQVLTALERKGSKYLRAIESKRLSKAEIEKALDGKIAEEATLITDKHPSFRAFVKDNQIKHKTILAKEHIGKTDKTIHLQNVNNLHSQLRTFLRPFNGVSSKYLQNYLNWFAYADKLRTGKTTIKQWMITIILSDQAYHLFELFKNNAVIIRT